MRKNPFPNRLLQDAREVYPELPSDKAMGKVFFNLGIRLAICVVVIWLAKWIIFLPRIAWPSQVFWGIIILATLAHLGYFLYTFHLYLQDNMRKAIERRNAELKKQVAKDAKSKTNDDLKTDGHP